jgi:hypothetical protein
VMKFVGEKVLVWLKSTVLLFATLCAIYGTSISNVIIIKQNQKYIKKKYGIGFVGYQSSKNS